MEYLLALLNKVQLTSPLPILQKEVIIIQNAGMQHWLNMSIAETRGISMNIDYTLPAQFLWKLARSLASKEKVPDQAPYSREVLSWRIYRLLNEKVLIDDEDFSHVVHYFSSNKQTESDNHDFKSVHEHNSDVFVAESEHGDIDDLKQYQLAVQLADLFEQYLIFRPEWLTAWQAGDFSLSTLNLNTHSDTNTEGSADSGADNIKMMAWQGKLWAMLQAESAYNPETLMRHATENLAECQEQLPPRICFFGINAMAPMWLDFIHQLSEFTQVHFFHLNPCADYWGDIKTEKQAFKNVDNWAQGYSDLQAQVGNPLLANLGQQGREFLAMLQNYSTYQFDVFDLAQEPESGKESNSKKTPILHAIQQDILTLTDTRQLTVNTTLEITTEEKQTQLDDSITITSAHSALREVQGLHDWLLHQFNHDPDLTPKDVLVMCPQIEQYAPYVDAVFVRGWQDLSSDIPPLPCSIADRQSKDAEPIIAAFLDLLSLPDSRFQVNQLLGLLRLNAVQTKFQVDDNELDKISHWLSQANIHWGLDQQHKSKILQSTASKKFTWQQGLSRLIRGFAYADTEDLYYDSDNNMQLLLPSIEGDDAILLGQLMLFLEQLQLHSTLLNKERTALGWQQYLHNLIDSCFADTDSEAILHINQAIEKMVEFSQEANFGDVISLSVMKSFLTNYFSQPDAGRQFMVGQVTFCSMLPMRSIPFKVIAVLGLNDGDFPRQRTPQAFDLMQQTPSRIGDRSRRGDDRYLFLEAIISARNSLYLSYQGRNIKNNSIKQPSLVLKELFAYLSAGYGWQCDVEKQNCHIRQLPMQAFSDNNYQGQWASFDNKWLTLLARSNNEQRANNANDVNESSYHSDHNASVSSLKLPAFAIPSSHDSITSQDVSTQASSLEQSAPVQPRKISLDELIRFFVHPSKMFAEQQLDLSLITKTLVLDDNEPFTDNQLTSYLYRQASLAIELDSTLLAEDKKNQQQALTLTYQLSGELPDLPFTDPLCEKWQKDSELFADEIKLLAHNSANKDSIHDVNNESFNITYQDISLCLPIKTENNDVENVFELHVRLPIYGKHIWLYRSSSAKAKDILTLAFYQLLLQHIKETVIGDDLTSEQQHSVQLLESVRGVYFDTKSQKVVKYKTDPIDEAEFCLQQLLKTYLAGQKQALLLNAKLGEKFANEALKNKPFTQHEFELFWGVNQGEQQKSAFHVEAFSDDPYIQYFWPQTPNFNDYETLLSDIYLPLFSNVVKLK